MQAAAAYPDLTAWLEEQAIPYERETSLREYTTFRLGGTADFFITPKNEEQLVMLQNKLAQLPVAVLLLGGGSNLLVSDAGFRGVVVHPEFGEEPKILTRTKERLLVEIPASARAPLTGKKLSAMGYSGVEFLTTIPGQFGGSVIQNAGCYGHELRDVLTEVRAAHTGVLRQLSTADCEFRYRDSRFKGDTSYWIAAATLELPAGDPQQIESRIADYKARRIASQPHNRRSAGSIFKNPAADVSARKAWQLIEAAGLRGVRQGGAEISAEHCNFIVNNGSATAADVMALIRLIEERVWENSGVRLEREVVAVGDFF